MDKPSWWPENPYPKTIFTGDLEDYRKIVPDPAVRTGLSGVLGREFWEIASKSIWDALKEHIEDIDDYIEQIKQLQTKLEQREKQIKKIKNLLLT